MYKTCVHAIYVMSDRKSEDSGSTCHRGMHSFKGVHTLEFMSRGADYRPVQFDRCLASCLICYSRRFTRSREVSADKSGTVWLVFGGVEEEARGSNWWRSYINGRLLLSKDRCRLWKRYNEPSNAWYIWPLITISATHAITRPLDTDALDASHLCARGVAH